MKLFPAFIPRLTPAALAGSRLAGLGQSQDANPQHPKVRADSLQSAVATKGPCNTHRERLIQLAVEHPDENLIPVIGSKRLSLHFAHYLYFKPGQGESLLMRGWAFRPAGNCPTPLRAQLQAWCLTETTPYADKGLSLRISCLAGGSRRVEIVGDHYPEFTITLPV